MSELRKVIAEIRSRIQRYGSPRKLNEENTKATLIDPVLRGLGWDVEDLEEVHREYKVKRRDRPVDYALLLLRTPRLFIEAKALGQNLNDRRWVNQIMGYAGVAGVEWIVLTDGDEYRLYNSHAPVAVEEKLFRTFRISDEGSLAEEMLLLLARERLTENRLDVLWQSHYVDQRVHRAIQEIFDPENDAQLVRLIKKHTDNLSPSDIRASLARASVTVAFPVEPTALPEKRARAKRVKPEKKTSDASNRPPKRIDVSVPDLIEARLVRPPLDLTKTYKGKTLAARIETDGRVRFGNTIYDSLSTAAGMARATVVATAPGRKYPQTNGWTFWKYRTPDGGLEEIDKIRQSYVRRSQLRKVE